MKPIPETARTRVISLLQAGNSIRETAGISGVSRSTVASIKKSLPFLPTEKKIGRPRLLDVRQERHIARMVSSGKWQVERC